jgi:Zn-dependent protease with chaperone function
MASMRLRTLLLFACLALPFAPLARAAETPTEHKANVAAQQEIDAAPRHGNLPDYTLAPADLAKAQHLSTVDVTFHFVSDAWGILSLVLLLWLGVIAWMRDRAVAVSANRWAQCFVFMFLYLIVGFLVSLPLDLYSQHLDRVYGLSVQSWLSWFGDQAKGLAIGWIVGGLLVMLLFWIIRKLPNRWWLLFWGFSIPIILAAIFITPYVIDPLFNKFEPLQKTNPELVARLEQVVQRGHMDIPPERMFLMKASAKVTTMNAYVTGFGSSKRVVVWDTSLVKGTPDEVLFIFGHESGHYVLGHIPKGIAFSFVLTFIMLYLGYRFVQWAIARFGAAWGIPSQSDWGALAVLLLAVSLFGLIREPIQSVFTRQQEHAADVYGQEAVHGLVADPQGSARGAFDVLGLSSYADPNPSPFFEFWTYSHPAIGRRAAFAAHYDPWAAGEAPKYFAKDSK